MFKQVILPILGVVAFIAIVGYFSQKSSNLAVTNFTPQPTTLAESTVNIGTKTINVQVAASENERTKGLSGVESLDENSGMLFVFDTKDTSPIFWMKDMLIPLDMIWINGGNVIRIDKNIPKPSPGTPDSRLKTFSAGVPVDYVLEVNAGFADQNKIKVGDSVSVSGI